MAGSSEHEIFLKRAKNELLLAELVFGLSEDSQVKIKYHISLDETFFSAAISHAYYCIFYSAKAYLLTKGIKTKPPEEHRKTLEEFKNLVKAGVVDEGLLRLYEQTAMEAEALLGIFRLEKRKRGHFTYEKIPQANKEPAKDSVKNSKTFFAHMTGICDSQK